jgi:hypothetical protein
MDVLYSTVRIQRGCTVQYSSSIYCTCTACRDEEETRDGCSATEMLVAYARHGHSPCERGEEGKAKSRDTDTRPHESDGTFVQ